MRYIPVRKGMEIGYAKRNDARYLTGRIDSIRMDVIYINGDGIPVRSLLIITNPVFADNNPDPVTYQGAGLRYRSDNMSWDVFVPTSHDLLSKATLNLAIADYMRELKRAKGTLLTKPSRNILFINLTRLAALDFAITYEHKISDLLIFSAEAGYKYGPGKGPNFLDLFYPYTQSGPSFVVGTKFVFDDKFYFAPLLHVKYLEINDSYYLDPFADGAAMKMDRYETDLGVSIRTGIMVRTKSVVCDFYAGGGIKYIIGHETDYEFQGPSGTHTYHPPIEKDLFLFKPIINLGMKLGVGF